ncbi:nucleotidyltransferase domain-containing protein [Candidatus Omnitrophota bacterium]
MVSLRSIITKKILSYFYINPESSLYVNEMERILNLDKRNLVKKVKELEEEGLIVSNQRGNMKFYSVNTEYPLYNEYRKIVMKTAGFEDQLKSLLKKDAKISAAYIYGSYAKDSMDATSDIDLLVIGGHSIVSLQKRVNALQREIDREINVVSMDEKEWTERKTEKDPFIIGILKGKHVKVI